jgi:predicted ATPase
VEPPIDKTLAIARGAFVGREWELRELRAGLEDAASGRGRLFLVAGEPGIGKTRLADEITNDARARGMRVFWGRCWEGEGAPPYWPWVQIMRSCVRDLDTPELVARMGAGATHVAQIVPEVAERVRDAVPLARPALADPQDARFQLFDAITSFFRNLSSATPLVLVLDDLHDADRSSLLLTQFLARELRESRILLIGTYREVETRRTPALAEVLAELGREGHCLPLRGFDESEAARFIESSAGIRPPAPLVRALYRSTDGNPFFLDELVRLLVAEGGLDRSDLLALGITRVPDRVREAVRRRLATLGEDCRAILAVASVILVRQRLTAVQMLTIAVGYAFYFPLILYLSANLSFHWALILAVAAPGATGAKPKPNCAPRTRGRKMRSGPSAQWCATAVRCCAILSTCRRSISVRIAGFQMRNTISFAMARWARADSTH